MNKIASLALVALVCLLTVGANAQTQNQKVGFVDVELIIENSRAIGAALDAVDRELAVIAREIDEKQREFRRQRFDLDRQERVLAESERESRRADLSALQEEIDRLQFELEQEMRVRERQIEPVLQKIMQIVADVAEEQGYAMVLRGEVVIYGNKAVDLTPAVISEVDAREAEIMELFGTEVQSDDEETSGIRERVPGQRPVQTPRAELPLIP
ncbi:OmpH family outer membrane protein [bacterium]|nr:OmpH family outer membrane protein [bacterium]